MFTSYDNDLWPGDTNGRPDVFIRDLQTGALVTPGFSTNAARGPAISDNGRYVVYERRHVLTAYSADIAVYRFDRETMTEELVATNRLTSSAAINGRPAISSNGNLGGFKGKLSGREIQEKIKLLEKERVSIINGKIDLGKYGFVFK